MLEEVRRAGWRPFSRRVGKAVHSMYISIVLSGTRGSDSPCLWGLKRQSNETYRLRTAKRKIKKCIILTGPARAAGIRHNQGRTPPHRSRKREARHAVPMPHAMPCHAMRPRGVGLRGTSPSSTLSLSPPPPPPRMAAPAGLTARNLHVTWPSPGPRNPVPPRVSVVRPSSPHRSAREKRGGEGRRRRRTRRRTRRRRRMLARAVCVPSLFLKKNKKNKNFLLGPWTFQHNCLASARTYLHIYNQHRLETRRHARTSIEHTEII
jgi:hypothetical protein